MLAGDSLATWKEAPVPTRGRNDTMGHNAAWLGWNNRIAGGRTRALAIFIRRVSGERDRGSLAGLL